MDFPSQFTSWIRKCISSAMYSVVMNGELEGFFKWKKKGSDKETPFLPIFFFWLWKAYIPFCRGILLKISSIFTQSVETLIFLFLPLLMTFFSWLGLILLLLGLSRNLWMNFITLLVWNLIFQRVKFSFLVLLLWLKLRSLDFFQFQKAIYQSNT